MSGTPQRAQLLVAITSFAIETGRREDDTPIMEIFLAGVSKRRSNDPAVKGREELFEPVSNSSDAA
jgi:hypothetical protein